MEWWQTALDSIATLEWWQVTLGFLAIILAGILVGNCISYLVLRFVYRMELSCLSILFWPFGKRPKKILASYQSSPSDKIPETTPTVKKQAEFAIPELLAELEYNRTIASGFSGENFLPFKTEVWDAHQLSAHDLPANLQNELERAYADIKFVNNLVWLFTELGYRSSNLEEQYRKMLTRIAGRLDEIKQIYRIKVS